MGVICSVGNRGVFVDFVGKNRLEAGLLEPKFDTTDSGEKSGNS